MDDEPLEFPLRNFPADVWAGWWAELANANRLRDLSEETRLTLHAAYLTFSDEIARSVGHGRSSITNRARMKWEEASAWKDRVDLADRLLGPAHRLAHRIVLPLLDGQRIPFRAFEEHGVVTYVQLAGEHGQISEVAHVKQQAFLPALALWMLLRPGGPFRIRRCPVCNRIFLRVGSKSYCTDSCRGKAADAKRDPEARKSQLREAAQKYRRRQRTATSENGHRCQTGTTKPASIDAAPPAPTRTTGARRPGEKKSKK